MVSLEIVIVQGKSEINKRLLERSTKLKVDSYNNTMRIHINIMCIFVSYQLKFSFSKFVFHIKLLNITTYTFRTWNVFEVFFSIYNDNMEDKMELSNCLSSYIESTFIYKTKEAVAIETVTGEGLGYRK